jgi:hypothetical protein
MQTVCLKISMFTHDLIDDIADPQVWKCARHTLLTLGTLENGVSLPTYGRIISSIMFQAPGLDVCTMHTARCLGKQGKHSMYDKKTANSQPSGRELSEVVHIHLKVFFGCGRPRAKPHYQCLWICPVAPQLLPLVYELVLEADHFFPQEALATTCMLLNSTYIHVHAHKRNTPVVEEPHTHLFSPVLYLIE